jgi:hypothetical protein
MKLGPICRKANRWLCVTLLIAASGGSTFALSGCDPTVSSTVLQGFSSLSQTLVGAFFTALENQNAQTQGTGTSA